MLAQWHEIKLSYPDKIVLDGVSLTVNPGDRIALLGENGAGKTSLFRILRSVMKPDSGNVSIPKGTGIGYLKQSLAGLEADIHETCIQVALDTFSHLMEMEERMQGITTRLTEPQPESQPEVREGLLEELGDLQDKFESDGGYTFRSRTESTLTNLGLSGEVWHGPVSSLSSGQRVRLALAKVLLEENDLLLLDEPTNHLDIEAREWLKGYLNETPAAVIVASHDRRFLDAVARKVAHLDLGKMKVYPGNYSAFRRQYEENTASEWTIYEKRQRESRKLKKQAQTYAGWSQSRERDKVGKGLADKGFIGARSARLMKKAKNAERRMEKKIEEMESEKPFEKNAVKIEFGGRRGRTLLVAEDLSIGHAPGRPLAGGLSIIVEGGDRLAIVGANGSGKTTLIRTLLGGMPALSGDIRRHPALDVGYFDQEQKQIPPGRPTLDAILDRKNDENDKDIDETLARTIMARMRIKRDFVYKPFGSLSAGERAKVLLTRLVLGDHDLLVLDEPTNYLDIETQDVVLDALSEFPGGIIFVSHDRHFVQTLSTDVIELK